MIKLEFDNDMILRAKEKADNLGSINNSILNGAGNFAGYLGEEAVANFLGAEMISSNEGKEKYNHDILFNGIRIEVKTKRRTVKPKSYYDVSVANTSTHQRPDVYAFVSLECGKVIQKKPKIYKGLIDVWLCGFMSSEKYFEKSVFYKKGDIDPSNNFKVHVDMHNLEISFLNDRETQFV